VRVRVLVRVRVRVRVCCVYEFSLSLCDILCVSLQEKIMYVFFSLGPHD